MRLALVLTAALATAPEVLAQASRDAQMLNLSCVEALVAIGQPQLAGVFSFVPGKDGPAALADLLVHERKAFKKYTAKLKRDKKEAGGISTWDHDTVVFALQIYASPIADTIDKPGSLRGDLEELARAPSMPLQELSARKRAR